MEIPPFYVIGILKGVKVICISFLKVICLSFLKVVIYMVCSYSCSISAVFIIGMIYFYNATCNNPTILQYKQQLSAEQQKTYEKIVHERLGISIKGYLLGIILSLLLIYYNYQKKHVRPASLVCMVVATSFLTNYFYYMVTPKTDWMLNHVESQAQTKAWLQMYRAMQYYYHFGLVLGILGIGVFAYAFC